MNSLINKTIKPFLIIAGLGTCVAGLYAFLPRFAVETVAKLRLSKIIPSSFSTGA